MEIKFLKFLKPVYMKVYKDKDFVKIGEEVWKKLNEKLPPVNAYEKYRIERFAQLAKHLPWVEQFALREYLSNRYDYELNHWSEHAGATEERLEEEIRQMYREHLLALHVPIPA